MAPLVAATLVATLLAGCSGSDGTARTGQAAPAISGTALDGTTKINLSAYRGHPVVVNFWASWCQPCRDEFPLFKDRLGTLGATDGLVVLGVLYKDQAELATPFVTDQGASWPTVTDPDGLIAAAYRVVAPPQTYFIDKDGVLRAIQIGQVKPADFDTQYAKIKP